VADVVHVTDGGGIVCSVDERATAAGVGVLRAGGSAADAAVAANAVLAVTSPHLCGMGGDLWAIVHEPGHAPVVLNASGRAGAGVDAAVLREAGHRLVPFRGDLAAVPVPGCVDGWMALLERFGHIDRATVLAPAIDAAEEGFPASWLLAMGAFLVDHLGVEDIHAGLQEGDIVRRPGVAEALRAVVEDGRDGFYSGAFGSGLLALGGGTYTAEDLQRSQADWHDALGLEVFGHHVWTAPPGSQGYLALAILHVAEQLGIPRDDHDPAWLRVLLAAAVVTGEQRPALLHEGALGAELLEPQALSRWVAAARRWPDRGAPVNGLDGDTTYLCVRDADGLAVSLIQSQASDFGAHLVEPSTGIFLHNRGVGFSLEAGHPAELAPGRRPPSTLLPMLVTDGRGELVAVTGTMGGDSQPHLMAQHLCRLLHSDLPVEQVLRRPRWVLKRQGDRGFDLWAAAESSTGDARRIEPADLALTTDDDGLALWRITAEGLGLETRREMAASPTFGHAHLIARTADGWIGCSEPRAKEGAAQRS
jgi:gamma-glutamyltranspeptidase/glutathione hydrolase